MLGHSSLCSRKSQSRPKQPPGQCSLIEATVQREAGERGHEVCALLYAVFVVEPVPWGDPLAFLFPFRFAVFEHTQLIAAQTQTRSPHAPPLVPALVWLAWMNDDDGVQELRTRQFAHSLCAVCLLREGWTCRVYGEGQTAKAPRLIAHSASYDHPVLSWLQWLSVVQSVPNGQPTRIHSTHSEAPACRNVETPRQSFAATAECVSASVTRTAGDNLCVGCAACDLGHCYLRLCSWARARAIRLM
jgi:hypothetical protein